MNTNDKITIMQIALKKMAKYIRENPPAALFSSKSIPFEIQIALLAGGSTEDPDGERYLAYFLNEATKEYKGYANDTLQTKSEK